MADMPRANEEKNFDLAQTDRISPRTASPGSLALEKVTAGTHFENDPALRGPDELHTASGGGGFSGFLDRLGKLSRHVDRGAAVGGDGDIPAKTLVALLPLALNQPVWRAMRRFDETKVADHFRAHDDVLEPWLRRVRFDSGKVLVEPDQEVTHQHHVIAGIHRRLIG